MRVSLMLFKLLEQLNKSLQSISATISGMFLAAAHAEAELVRLRNDDQFKLLFEDVQRLCTESDITLWSFRDSVEHLSEMPVWANLMFLLPQKIIFVQPFIRLWTLHRPNLIADLTKGQLVCKRLSLEKILLSGNFPARSEFDVYDRYSEFSQSNSLHVELQMFRGKYPVKSVSEAHRIFQEMVPKVRSLFSSVEHLIRLLLICPVSSCTAERSFSALRRLKNWLRNSISHWRLNSIAICHVNQDVLEELDLKLLAIKYAQRSEVRREIFGLWRNV